MYFECQQHIRQPITIYLSCEACSRETWGPKMWCKAFLFHLFEVDISVPELTLKSIIKMKNYLHSVLLTLYIQNVTHYDCGCNI